jgi:hypothetical protein
MWACEVSFLSLVIPIFCPLIPVPTLCSGLGSTTWRRQDLQRPQDIMRTHRTRHCRRLSAFLERQFSSFNVHVGSIMNFVYCPGSSRAGAILALNTCDLVRRLQPFQVFNDNKVW